MTPREKILRDALEEIEHGEGAGLEGVDDGPIELTRVAMMDIAGDAIEKADAVKDGPTKWQGLANRLKLKLVGLRQFVALARHSLFKNVNDSEASLNCALDVIKEMDGMKLDEIVPARTERLSKSFDDPSPRKDGPSEEDKEWVRAMATIGPADDRYWMLIDKLKKYMGIE